MNLVANDCVFIDDLEKNCLGAEAVGISSIWVKYVHIKHFFEKLFYETYFGYESLFSKHLPEIVAFTQNIYML